MLYPTQVPSITSFELVRQLVSPGLYNCGNPIFSLLTFNKLPENPVITPTTSVQVVRPSAFNRYLESVTVNAIPTSPTP
jgi:hypothetical protein